MTTMPAPSIAATLLTGTATGPFPTGFKYNAAEDVRVWLELAGIRQPDLTLTTDYTLTGATPLVDGGTVTLDAGLVPEGGWDEDAGDRVVIARRTVKRQALALPDTEGHKPRSTEAALDKLMRVGEEQAEVLDRTLSVPAGEEGLQLPPIANRTGGAILALTEDGTQLDLSRTTAQFDIDVASAASNAGTATTAAGVAVAARDVTTAARDVTTAARDVTTAARDVATGAASTASGAATTAVTARDVTTAARDVTTAARDVASAAATTATAAANAAAALANMHASTVAGLAATPNGGYFSVEPDSGGVVNLYRDDAGVATLIGAVMGMSRDHKSRLQVPPRLQGHRGQGLKFRKALSDIRSGARKSLRTMVIGDSLAGITWQTVAVQMMKELEGWMQTTPVYGHSISVLDYGTFSDSAAASTQPRTTTGTDRFKQDFDGAWDGSLMWLETGQASTFSIGGLAVQGDRIYVPIIREPGAGSVKIEISSATTPPALGGAWSNPTAPQIVSAHSLTGGELLVNANGAFGVEMVVLSVALGSWTVKVSHSAGSKVRVRYPMHEVRTAAAFNIWRVGSASNDFTSAQTSAQTIEAAQIAAYDPDIIVVESDDRLAAYQNFLPKLEAAIAASGLAHKPLVLLVINPYYINGPYTDADIIARADYCHDFAATRVGWDVLDGMAISGGQVEAAAAGYNVDNIHYTGELSRWMARVWLASRGYLPSREQVGGSADTALALLGPTSNANGANRQLVAKSVAALLLQSTAFDTTTCAWAGSTPVGSASYARGNAGDITLATGSTGSSSIASFINQNGSLLGISQGNIRGESRGFAVRIRTTTAWDANTLGFILIRKDGVAYNSGYNGTLTDEGWGFRLSFDGTNILIHGICWRGALVVSSGSAILPSGAASSVKDLAVVLSPATINVTRGTLEWFVAGVSLGTANYDHGGVFLLPRVELTNGATATNRSLLFMPPKFLSAPQ